MSLEIKKLDYEEYKGKEYEAEITSDRCLVITPDERGFNLYWKKAEPSFRMTIRDKMLSDWLEEPVAYGAFEDDELVGFIEGFHEKWNNRFRISNICVFDGEKRKHGIGTRLMKQILIDAGKSGARMAVLETQSGNYKAVSFYEKMGFEIIGFDRYAYSNNGPEENNMRIEMGMEIKMNNEKIYGMLFSKVYPLLIAKAERKGHTKNEVDEITCWLTGYTVGDLDGFLESNLSYGEFFLKAPELNPDRKLITGSVCGVRVEAIEEPLMQEIRYLDKLVDELAKGKSMDKILRR